MQTGVENTAAATIETAPLLLFDDAFCRGEVPMTKQEVRAAVLLALQPRAGETVWDIGAGTGSVSVELARHGVSVIAIEKEAEAVRLMKKNASVLLKEDAHLTVIHGEAPEICRGLAVPDKVFIGGSGRRMPEILDTVLTVNHKARIVAAAILTETFAELCSWFEKRGLGYSVTQITVSRSQNVGGKHMMRAENPVWLVTGNVE